MRKFLLISLATTIILSCNNKTKPISTVKTPQRQLDLKLKIVAEKPLHIIVPDSVPIDYGDAYVFNDSLFYGLDNNKIQVFDLKRQKHIKTIVLDMNFFRQDLQNLVVKSFDSILVFNSYPPKMYLINSKGKICNQYTFGNLKLKIGRNDLPKDEILYTFPKFYGFVKPVIVSNFLYLPIAPIGAEEMRGYTKTQRIGVYNLKNKKWYKAIAPPKGLLATLKNKYYNYDLMQTFFTVAHKKLYVNYPISHYSYVYTLQGKFIDSVNTKSRIIKKIPKPMSLKQLDDRQKSWNFRITTPFYGPLFYHKKSDVFTRTAYEKQPLKMNNGKLNDGKKRKGSIMIFNRDFTKFNELVLDSATLGVGKNYPLGRSILVGRQQKYWKNENEFIHKYLYTLIHDEK